MKHIYLALLAVAIFLTSAFFGHGQVVQNQVAGNPPQSEQVGDLIRELNLTPEQREQIRSIREQNKDERATINSRLSEANRALLAALDADAPDETVVEQRMQEVAAAQAAAMRMRILTEVRIRRVLTLEQRNTLRILRQQAAERRRERINPERRRRREERTLQNPRNGLGPLFRNQRRPRL